MFIDRRKDNLFCTHSQNGKHYAAVKMNELQHATIQVNLRNIIFSEKNWRLYARLYFD